MSGNEQKIEQGNDKMTVGSSVHSGVEYSRPSKEERRSNQKPPIPPEARGPSIMGATIQSPKIKIEEMFFELMGKVDSLQSNMNQLSERQEKFERFVNQDLGRLLKHDEVVLEEGGNGEIGADNADPDVTENQFQFNDTVALSESKFDSIIEEFEEGDFNVETAYQHKFIELPSREVEKALMNNHQTLRAKVVKNDVEKARLNNCRSDKLPNPSKVSNFVELFNFIKMVVYLKMSYMIPDYVIKPVIREACLNVKHESFGGYIALSLDEVNDALEPVPYSDILAIVASEVPKIETSDITSLVANSLDTIGDPKYALLSIKVLVARYVTDHLNQKVPDLSWVAIWRMLVKKLPKTFELVVNGLDDTNIRNELNLIKVSDKSNIVLVGSIKMDHLLGWKKFMETFTKISKVTDLSKLDKTEKTEKNGTVTKSKDAANFTKRELHCEVCGSTSHTFRRCYQRKDVTTKFGLSYYSGCYHDKEGKEYKLAKGESLVNKYPQFRLTETDKQGKARLK